MIKFFTTTDFPVFDFEIAALTDRKSISEWASEAANKKLEGLSKQTYIAGTSGHFYLIVINGKCEHPSENVSFLPVSNVFECSCGTKVKSIGFEEVK